MNRPRREIDLFANQWSNLWIYEFWIEFGSLNEIGNKLHLRWNRIYTFTQKSIEKVIFNFGAVIFPTLTH